MQAFIIFELSLFREHLKPLLLYIILLSFLFPDCSRAQTNYNAGNGLPSNHVYSVTTDHVGYLWIATKNGVVRFNGYTFTKFTTADGLPSNDVWQLTEDKKGRIWLGSIADKFGYIYNEKYYSSVFRDTGQRTIYPQNTIATDDKIYFTSHYVAGSLNQALCAEKNDTITAISFVPYVKKLLPFAGNLEEKSTIEPMINKKGDGILLCKGYLLQFRLSGSGVDLSDRILKITDSDFITGMYGAVSRYINNYLVYYRHDFKTNYFAALNVQTGKTYYIKIDKICPGEHILHIDQYNDRGIYIVTERHIVLYSVSNDIIWLKKENIQEISGNKELSGESILTYSEIAGWGTFICNSASGLAIRHSSRSFFTPTRINLKNYTYVATTEHGISLWWNSALSMLASIRNNQVAYQRVEPQKIQKIRFTADLIHLGSKDIFYDPRTNKISSLRENTFTANKYFCIADTPDITYGICNYGFYRSVIGYGDDSIKYLDKDRFTGIEWDKQRKTYWVYNRNRLLKYGNHGTKEYLRQTFENFGINTIDQISIDNIHGNIFFKGGARLSMYNSSENKATALLQEFNLNESAIKVQNDILIVYGRHGLVFLKIYGPNNISEPIYYPNIKNSYYSTVTDVQIFNNEVLLNTDAGLYHTIVPPASDFQPAPAHPVFKQYPRYIYYTNNGPVNVNNGDTIILNQDSLALRFDVINPFGNGNFILSVNNNKNITELRSNTYSVNSKDFAPGKYYTIQLSGYDDVWNGEKINLHIFIKPLWWQTQKVKLALVTTLFLSVLGLITVSIIITRRLVLRATQKRQAIMELELKSIYAQINPHFIFNSLNSALLLVSKNQAEDAYTHISKFSRLLRSYIKSSRNKYVVLADEIRNLTNYIDLQQVRFKDKFSYSITTTDDIDISATTIPSLLLQPFVENAIEHGLLQRESGGELKIEFCKHSSEKLLCIIDDNGIGRIESKLNKMPNPIKEESYGDLLIKDLVSIFNKYEHMNIKVSYIDKELPLTGTTVTIEIALNTNKYA